MGTHRRRNSPLLPVLALLASASAATLQPQPQALVPGYGKEFRPFGNYNGIPIAPRASPWIRAAEIQSANAEVYPGEGRRPAFPEQQAFGLQRGGPQFPVVPAPREQQAPPADVFIYQEAGPLPPVPRPYSSGSSGDQGPQTYEHSMLLIDHPPEQLMRQQRQPEQRAVFRSGNGGDQGPQTYEHSMLLIDHPPEQMMPQQGQPEQQTIVTGNSGDQGPQTYEHSMLLIDHPPEQMMPQQGQPEQQTIITSDDSDDSDDVKPVLYEHSMLELDHPADEAQQQQQDQQPAMSGSPVPAESPAEETVQVQVAPADQQTSAQESGVATAQVTQQDSSVPQGPMFMPYQQGPRPFGVIFQSNEPYPGLRPPPAYQLEQVAWGVQPGQVPVYPAAFREQPPQQEQQPIMSPVFERPLPAAYYPDDFQVKGGYQPFLNQRRAFDARPVVEDRLGAVPRPPGGVAPFPMAPSYVPETPLEEAAQPEVVPDKNEQSESRETEKNKDDDAKDDDDEASDEIENKVKALKDAADVEEEVVPALVVFLRKKGHKAFHDKDSVGIPGKEDRFRRSPSSGSGSSSHSSSSSSSSSGPVYFGDGGSGSYSSSSSQSSASSSSGGGAPLGLGASGPGVGGGGAFYGGGHVPPSGYGVSGVGGGAGGGYGNSGYGNSGYGNTGYGNSGYGGGAGGGGGYGGGYGGVGPSGGGGSYGGGCTTCGEDSNVLLNRFGEVEGGAGPFTVGGSGASKGQGVHSSASSSIDSTGKVTYTAFAGKH